MEKRIAVLLCAVSFVAVAFAQTERHRAVRSGEATSEALIQNALDSGKIDAETALTYRIYATVLDCRLPAEFRGDDSTVEDSLVLAELAADFSNLSVAAQANLAPFLKPPYAPNGWMQQRQATCGSGKGIASDDIITTTLFAVDGKVLITYRSDIAGESQKAQAIKTELETTIYPNLTKLMGEPLASPGSALTWDLSLVEIPQPDPKKYVGGLTGFSDGVAKQGRAYSNVDPRRPDLLSVVAHELMHAIQYGYPLQTSSFVPYIWIAEATATWAQDYIYPNPPPPPVGDAEHVQAPNFLGNPELPLDCAGGADCPGHDYGAYLLPFYISGRHKDDEFVHRIWLNAAMNGPLDSVNVALTPYKGFDNEWPEFVRYNWNHEPYDDYQKWDHLHDTAAVGNPNENLVILGSEDRTYEMGTAVGGFIEGPLTLQSLSAQYFDYKFDDPKARSVAFLNGINFKLSNRVWSSTPDLGPLYVFDNAPKPRTGLKIQALLKINGTWETTPRDWTQIPFVPFCRDIPAERLEELVLIYSNSNYHDRAPLVAPDITPILAVSNMGCAGWTADQAIFQETDGVRPLKMTWSASFRRSFVSLDFGPMPTLPAEGIGVTFMTYTGSGDLAWSVNGSINGCTWGGGSTIPLDRIVFFTFNFTPPGALVRRGYGGTMGSSQMVHYTRSCPPNGTESHDQFLPSWTIFTPDDMKTVAADGITIHDEHAKDFDLMGKIQWTFKYTPP